MCFSVTGGDPSWIGGTFREYLLPGLCRWETSRLNYMLLDIMQSFAATGHLPNAGRTTDPSIGLPSASEIDSASDTQLRQIIASLGTDALLSRVFADVRSGGPAASEKELLHEVRSNLTDKAGKPRLTWGTG